MISKPNPYISIGIQEVQLHYSKGFDILSSFADNLKNDSYVSDVS